MELLDDFFVRAILAGLAVVLAAAPLGCFVVWRRMAYFGDATAHAAVLGVALSLAFSMHVMAGVLAVALAMGLAVTHLAQRNVAIDTGLGVMSHAALAAGLVAVSFIDGVRVDLMAFLFGDILAVSPIDLAMVWWGAILVLALLVWRWSPLLTATLSPDLARAAGINPKRETLVITVGLALVVAVAIKLVGALLIGALLVIPPAAARVLSSTPERMAVIAALFGGVSVIGGLYASLHWDTPAGPTIVCAAALIFITAQMSAQLKG